MPYPSPPENPAPALSGPLQIKRGANTAIPTLFDGQLAVTWSVSAGDWNRLYVGTPGGTNKLLLDVAAVAAVAALAFGGDLSGTYASQTVTGLQGKPVDPTAPTSGQVLAYNSTSGKWTPTAPTPAVPTGTAGGDLGGSYPSPTVAGIKGVPISTTAPTNGQVLAYNSSLTQWVPTTVAGSGGSGTVTSIGLAVPGGFVVSGGPITSSGTLTITTTLSGIIKGDGAGNFVAAVAGTDFEAPLGNPAVNGYLLASTTAGVRSWVAPSTLTAPDATTGAKGVVQLAGDIAGTAAAPTVVAVRGQPWAGDAPSAGQFPSWSGTNWTPHTLTGSDIPVFGPSGASHGPGAVPDPGATAGTTRALFEDGNWKNIASSAGGTVTSVAASVPAGLSATVTNPTGAASIAVTNTLGSGIVKSASGGGYSLAAPGADYEAPLGNPSTSGYVLASTTAGVRSWVPLPSGGSGGGTTVWNETLTLSASGTQTNWNLAHVALNNSVAIYVGSSDTNMALYSSGAYSVSTAGGVTTVSLRSAPPAGSRVAAMYSY